MSYQFEDESALEELLNQQLDRRKQQTSRSLAASSSRPNTAASKAPVSQQRRPSSGTENSASKSSKLSAWLEGAGASVSGSSKQSAQPPNVLDGESGQYSLETTATNLQKSSIPFVIDGESSRQKKSSNEMQQINTNNDENSTPLSNLLTPERLQEMSKQRLIQLILEQVVPHLSSQAQVASKQLLARVEQLTQELQVERNRLQVIELRHEEQLKLEVQKAAQLSGQLELRLETSERELTQLMDSQRAHLESLDEQHKKSLSSLVESYEKRAREERARFDEILAARDEMHQLEMAGRLNVSSNLTQLNTLQEEWRQTLASTIGQLEGHFAQVQALLDKQTLQVKGTNSELAQKANKLVDQYDKFDAIINQKLTSVTSQISDLLPQLARSHERQDVVCEQTNRVLATLEDKLSLLEVREKTLDNARAQLDVARREHDDKKLKLALDQNRLSMKEERLDELLKMNGERELKLAHEQAALLEQQTAAQIKRVSLDERAADLKEQNYTLHLLRKRLTCQREELLRSQVAFVEEKKALKSERARLLAESKKLTTLRARAQRELDQLRRLQRSLVCSLCMGRLFGGGQIASKYETQFAMDTINDEKSLLQKSNNNDDNQQHDQRQLDDELREVAPLQEGQHQQRQQGQPAVTITKNNGARQEKTMPTMMMNGHHQHQQHHLRTMPMATSGDMDGDDNDLDFELRQAELESGKLAAENKYIEQLLLAS